MKKLLNSVGRGVKKVMDEGREKVEMLVGAAVESFSNDKNRKIVGLILTMFGLGIYLSGYIK